MPPLPHRIDVHCHIIPEFYLEALIASGHVTTSGASPAWSPGYRRNNTPVIANMLRKLNRRNARRNSRGVNTAFIGMVPMIMPSTTSPSGDDAIDVISISSTLSGV